MYPTTYYYLMATEQPIISTTTTTVTCTKAKKKFAWYQWIHMRLTDNIHKWWWVVSDFISWGPYQIKHALISKTHWIFGQYVQPYNLPSYFPPLPLGFWWVLWWKRTSISLMDLFNSQLGFSEFMMKKDFISLMDIFHS